MMAGIRETLSAAEAFAARFADAFSTGSAEALVACLSDDAVLEHPMFGRVVGRDGILGAESGLFSAFDEVGVQLSRVVDGGEWSAVSYVIHAHQTADIPLPDGNVLVNLGARIVVPGCEIFRLGANGLAVETHRYHDTAAMFGALASGIDMQPAPSTPASDAGVSQGPAPDAASTAARVKAAYDAADLQAIADCYSAEAALVHPIAGVVSGRDAIGQAESMLASCFSEFDFRILRVVQDGWWAAFELMVSATHTAPLPLPDGSVIAPTGRRVTDRVAQLVRLAPDGRMAFAERYFDAGALMMQLTT